MSLKPLRIAVVMDPIEDIKPRKDTTLAMLLAAQRRGWDLHYLELPGIWLRDGVALGRAHPIGVREHEAICRRRPGDVLRTGRGRRSGSGFGLRNCLRPSHRLRTRLGRDFARCRRGCAGRLGHQRCLI